MPMKANTSTLANEAYGIVRRRLLRGQLSLGQAVSRRKLAAELGMSFLPVSEALLRLEFEGLLESRPRAGTRVRIPSADDVYGHYLVRETLEVQAAKLFAEVASRAEGIALRRLGARVDRMQQQADRKQYLGVHYEFHRRIAEGARCPVLSAAIEQTNALSSTWFCVFPRPKAVRAPRRHQDLAKALASGSPARAAAAMRQHVRWSRRESLERLKPYFELRESSGRTFSRSAKRVVH
jgi:DNA-binding GntR family transcriptional regulator